MKKKVLGIIPARYSSTRFPGKVIHKINNLPMICHVYNQSVQSKLLDNILIATDNEKVYEVCKNYSIPVKMTSENHKSGTERIIEACQGISADIIVNIQGDEPLIQGSAIDQVIEPILYNDYQGVVTLKKNIIDRKDITSQNVVKVVCNKQNEAMYFSRNPIPYSENMDKNYFKHIGIYAYPKELLLKFGQLNPTEHELSENLEQLRYLENKIAVLVLETSIETIGVDIKEDILRVENILNQKSINI